MILGIIGAVIIGFCIGFVLCAFSAREIDRRRVKSGMMMVDNAVYKLTLAEIGKEAKAESEEEE